MKKQGKVFVCLTVFLTAVTAGLWLTACGQTGQPDEHEHTLTLHAEVAATCTENGTEAYWECSGCEKLFSDAEAKNEIAAAVVIPAAHGTLVKTDEVAATCTENGAEAYWSCPDCGVKFSDEAGTAVIDTAVVIPAAHGTLVKTDGVAATCTEDGAEAYWNCPDCGVKFSDEAGTIVIEDAVVISATSHSDGEKVYEHKEGTEVHIWKCSNANCPGVEENCDYDISVSRDSCDEAGVQTSVCRKCGNTVTAQLAAGEHAYGAPVWTWTASDGGYTVTAQFVCAQGDDTQTPAATVTENRTAATCTEAGSVVYTAKVVCGGTEYTDSKTDAISAEGHTVTAHAEVAATCTEDGTGAYWECTACGKLFADGDCTHEIASPVTIAAEGHEITAHSGVAATCTESGTEAYWECTVCDKLFADADCTQQISAPSVVSAAGHAITAHAEIAATCTEDGTEAYWECTACGKLFADADCSEQITEPVSIGSAGHGNVTKIEAAQAAETLTALSGSVIAAKGLDHYACSDCGKKYVDEALTLEITVTTASTSRVGAILDVRQNLLYAQAATHYTLFQAPEDGIYVFTFANTTINRIEYTVTDKSPVTLYSNNEWVLTAAYADKVALNSGKIESVFYVDMKQGELISLSFFTVQNTIFEIGIAAIEEAEHMLVIGSNEISVAEADVASGVAYQFTSIADDRYRIFVPETSAAYIWIVENGVSKPVISALEGTVSYMFKAKKGETITFYLSVDTVGGTVTFPASYTVTVENNVNFPEIAIGETPTLVNLSSGYSSFDAIIDAETAGTYIFKFDRNGAPNSLLRNYYYLYVNGVKQETMIQASTNFTVEIELKAGENLICIENAMPQNASAVGAPVVVLPKE